MQGFVREKDENRADLRLRYTVFSFESDRLWCSILVIKMAIKFQVSRNLQEREGAQELMAHFLKLIIEWIKKHLAQMQSIK